MRVVNLPQLKPTLVIPEEVSKDIHYVCQNSPTGQEWSGPFFYQEEGDLMNVGEMKFTLKKILPVNIGDGTYTEYDFEDNDIMNFQLDNPELLEEDIVLGHLHSHHNMGVFFSGTDMKELNDNSESHYAYLSLIVNNRGHKVAKYCYRGTCKVTHSYLHSGSGLSWTEVVEESEEVLFVHDVVIQEENSFRRDDWLSKALDKAVDKKEAFEAEEKRKKALTKVSKTPKAWGTVPNIPAVPSNYHSLESLIPITKLNAFIVHSVTGVYPKANASITELFDSVLDDIKAGIADHTVVASKALSSIGQNKRKMFPDLYKKLAESKADNCLYGEIVKILDHHVEPYEFIYEICVALEGNLQVNQFQIIENEHE